MILGSVPDRFIDKLNTFMLNLSTLRQALITNHFPMLVANLLYAPLVFFVLILNALRAEILSIITTLLLFVLSLILVGAIITLLFVCIRGQ